MVTTTTDKPHCPECGWTPHTDNKSYWNAMVGKHRSVKHGVPGTSDKAKASTNGHSNNGHEPKEPKASPLRELRARAAAEGRLVTIIAELFPKGIPTNDPVRLMEDLHLVDRLRATLRGTD